MFGGRPPRLSGRAKPGGFSHAELKTMHPPGSRAEVGLRFYKVKTAELHSADSREPALSLPKGAAVPTWSKPLQI
jgi:hypothetical protein